MRGAGIFILLLSSGILIMIFYILTNLYAYSFSRTGLADLYREFYECGFRAVPDTRIAIDIQFSILGLIFLLYDMEVVILVPLIVNSQSLFFSSYLILLLIIFILGLSYWYEWERFALQWGFN